MGLPLSAPLSVGLQSSAPAPSRLAGSPLLITRYHLASFLCPEVRGSECLTVVFRSAAGDAAQPVAAVSPSVLNVQQGQRAEFRCTATGNPTPAVEWTGRPRCSQICASASGTLGRRTSVNVICSRWACEQDESQSRDTRRRAGLCHSGRCR